MCTRIVKIHHLKVGIEEWTRHLGSKVERIGPESPPIMPEPSCKLVAIACFVDSNHSKNIITRRPPTGTPTFAQNALITFHSKGQNIVETSAFVSVMKMAKKMTVAIQFELGMFSIPIDGLENVSCDNQGAVNDASTLELALNKKQVSMKH